MAAPHSNAIRKGRRFGPLALALILTLQPAYAAGPTGAPATGAGPGAPAAAAGPAGAGAAPAIRAQDEYRVQPGDGLELSVSGFPDLRQKATVNVDGVIALPVFGSFKVAGKTMAEAVALVRAAVPSRAVHMRTSDGRDNLFAIEETEVNLALVDYRPIYLRGDIAKPGEQSFRPGLTVRQAVALAGGYDLVRFRVSNPFLDAADLRSQYEGLWTDYARQQLRIARLQAELDGREQVDPKSLFPVPIPTPVLNQLTELELQQLKLNQQSNRAEMDYLRRSAAQAQTYVDQLTELQKQLAAGTAAQAENLKRIQGVVEKGLASVNRTTEEQRVLLAQADRSLVAASELTKAQKSLQDASREIDRTSDRRRTQALADLQDAKGKLATLTSQIQAVSDKLLYVGSLRSQLVRGTGNRVQLLVFRRDGDGKTVQIPANEDTALAAGDVVEIALRTEEDYTGAARP